MAARCYYLWTLKALREFVSPPAGMLLPRVTVLVVPLVLMAAAATVGFHGGFPASLVARCAVFLLLWASFCFQGCHGPRHAGVADA